jgi:Tol biopolymer transport system component
MIGMHRVIRWALGAGVLALLLTVGVAGAVAPTGPRLAVAKHTWKPSLITLLTVGPNGGRPIRVGGGDEDSPLDTILLAPLSWRPDGSEFAFSGLGVLFLVRADGSGARRVNAAGAELPVFAPDGHTIAFTRSGGREEAIWTIDLDSGTQRQLTPWRRGLRYITSSFSPDGTTLLATRFDTHRTGSAEPVALHLDTGGVTRLLGQGREPVYSPDGSEIALFRAVGGRRTDDLFVMDAASGTLRRLTRTPDKDEYFASWDPSGERIAFARFQGANIEWANSIVQINADGTCETEILARRRTLFFGPAWQPGPGREAGPIDC